MDKMESPPIKLLLLADPSIEMIEDYLNRGETYICEENGQVVAVFVMLATRPGACEIANIAVRGWGLGKS